MTKRRFMNLSHVASISFIASVLAGCVAGADVTDEDTATDGEAGEAGEIGESREALTAPQGRIAKFFRSESQVAGGATTSGVAIPATSYGRGAGVPLNTCDPGFEQQGSLCYPKCNSGYVGVGPVCWQVCPAGYSDDGATCRRDARIISANNSSCPWYDKCGVTLAKGCSVCPPGYTNDGCTCRLNAHIFGKSSYGRGAGVTPHCRADQDQNGALCYPKCETGYQGVGPVCWLQNLDVNSCQELYDATLAGAAWSSGTTMTYGFGVGIEAGATLGAETGVVYGRDGEFGCYLTTCAGVATNISIGAWGGFSLLDVPFSGVQGQSLVVSAAAGEIVGFQTSEILTTSGQFVGTANNISLSAGVLPIEVGFSSCNTWVQQL